MEGQASQGVIYNPEKNERCTNSEEWVSCYFLPVGAFEPKKIADCIHAENEEREADHDVF